MADNVRTVDILDRLVAILKERMPKYARAVPELRTLEPVQSWALYDAAMPAPTNGRPLGYVFLRDRGVERDPQDHGDRTTLEIVVQIAFDHRPTGTSGHLTAIRYVDALMLTINKESRGKDPRDGTVLPGWFRAWAYQGQPLVHEQSGAWIADVRVRLEIDSVEEYAI